MSSIRVDLSRGMVDNKQAAGISAGARTCGGVVTVSSDWRLDIQTNRVGSLIALALLWLVFGPLIAWAILGEMGLMFLLACAAFPLLITYYGLKSAFGKAGHVSIDRDGFSVQRPDSGVERFEWPEVRRFFVGKFGATEIYDGSDVPHFEFADGTGGWRESWLPGNLGIPPDQLVMAMEKLRTLAMQGWPTRPASIEELLQQDQTP